MSWCRDRGRRRRENSWLFKEKQQAKRRFSKLVCIVWIINEVPSCLSSHPSLVLSKTHEIIFNFHLLKIAVRFRPFCRLIQSRQNESGIHIFKSLNLVLASSLFIQMLPDARSRMASASESGWMLYAFLFASSFKCNDKNIPLVGAFCARLLRMRVKLFTMH